MFDTDRRWLQVRRFDRRGILQRLGWRGKSSEPALPLGVDGGAVEVNVLF
jgi:hypothetical protein